MMRPRLPFSLAPGVPRLALVMLALAPLALAGCAKPSAAELSVAVIGEGPLSLGDPLAPPADHAQATLRLAVAQGLVRFDSAGQVEPGLAERWNVSDDGLSYIFRLASGEWPDGRRIMARDVARILTRLVASNGDDPTREALGAVDKVVAMTDRVIEIRLRAPRPTLLHLLAQPEFALVREGVGTGPFTIRHAEEEQAASDPSTLRLTRKLRGFDGEPGARENVRLSLLSAAAGIAAFRADRVDLLLGGTIADLPLVTRVKLDRGALRFDPASGLFGLKPLNAEGMLGQPEVRRLLSEAIDRDSLIATLAVPGLVPRATLLQAGLDGLADPVQPAWLAQPLVDRRAALDAQAQRIFGAGERPRFTVSLPLGPGGDLLLSRLAADWGAIGISVERAASGRRADFALVDLVAPSSSPAWYLRQFRCAVAPVCIGEADELLDAAREAAVAAQRAALLAQVAALFDESTLFMPLTAPIRWSLVGDRAAGFQENRFARHPLTGIMRRTPPRGFSQ